VGGHDEFAAHCCASFAASLPLAGAPRPISPRWILARYLLTRSEGTIGELAHLYDGRRPVALPWRGGEEAIQPSHAQHGDLHRVPASGGGNSSGKLM